MKSKLTTHRKREIIELAEEVAETHCPGQVIDPIQILQNKQVTFSFNYYGEGFDGMLEHLRGRFHMYGNLDRVESRTTPRARFTSGHELGHYFIDEHRNALIRGVPPHLSVADQVEPERVVEEEADLFASHLLMPKSRFETWMKTAKPGLGGILKTAKYFAVSCSSAALRVLPATEEPLAMVYWRSERGPWTYVNAGFEAYGLSHIKRRAEQLPRDCATTLAMADSASSFKEEPRTCTTLASSWFAGVFQGSARDVVLQEEAIRLGRFGVLTILRSLHQLTLNFAE